MKRYIKPITKIAGFTSKMDMLNCSNTPRWAGSKMINSVQTEDESSSFWTNDYFDTSEW